MKLFGTDLTLIKNTDAAMLSDLDIDQEVDKRHIENRFPMDIFPEQINNWIRFQITQMQLEPCFIGTTIIQVASIAIGSAVRGKMGFFVEKPSLFTVLAGYTSSGKSLCTNQNMKPIVKYQKMLDDENGQDVVSEEKNDKGYSTFTDQTKAIYTSDATFDAFIQLLSNNPKGVTRYYDEFYTYFHNIDRLKVNAGDTTFWTAAWNSDYEHRVKRMNKKGTNIPKNTLFCNLMGTTQPDFLKLFFMNARYEQGYSWRFLYAIQPVYKVAEVDADLEFPQAAYDAYEFTIMNIFERHKIWTHGREPKILTVTAKGRALFKRWNEKQLRILNDLKDINEKNAKMGIHGKMKQYIIRFATTLKVLHESATISDNMYMDIEEKYMQYAIQLADYYMISNYEAYQQYHRATIIPHRVKRMASALKKHNFNVSEAARDLGYSRQHFSKLYNEMKMEYPAAFDSKNK